MEGISRRPRPPEDEEAHKQRVEKMREDFKNVWQAFLASDHTKTLSDEGLKVFELRHGFGDGEQMTFREVTALINDERVRSGEKAIRRERVEALYNSALRILKHPAVLDAFPEMKSYLEYLATRSSKQARPV